MSNEIERIIQIIKSKDTIITTQQITHAGLHRSILRQLVDKGEIYRFSRGLYVQSDSWEDEFYLLQKKYSKGIYSHNTALYLLGLSDRTPARYDMTFPRGYNSLSLKKESITITRVIKENYNLGIIQTVSPCGNILQVYDVERTICDILRGSCNDIQIIVPALRQYVTSKKRNIGKLLEYADRLRIKSKILRYLEVLL